MDRLGLEAAGLIEQWKGGPFYLYLATYAVHTPIEPRKEDVPKYEAKVKPGMKHQNAPYAALVQTMDDFVGKVLQTLDETGLADRTVVFFTSDNGPSAERLHSVDFFDSNGIYRGVKRDLYEGALRVPMVVRWPGHVPAGVVSAEPWAFWDVLPTRREDYGANIYNRYPQSSCAQRAPALYTLCWPGPEGAETTQRFEALCQGVQETEAMLAVSAALDKPGANVAKEQSDRARKVLYDRLWFVTTRPMTAQWSYMLNHVNHFGWQELARRTFDSAAEMGARYITGQTITIDGGLSIH